MPRAAKKCTAAKKLQSGGNITSATSAAHTPVTAFQSPHDTPDHSTGDPVDILDTPYDDQDFNDSAFNKRQWRNVCMTLNNYTDAELAQCQTTAQRASYGIIALEVAPTTGTPHLQMYFEFKNSIETTRLRSLTSPRCAFFVRKGTPIQASSYCRGNYMTTKGVYKPLNAVVFEYGTLSRQGARNDWTRIESGLTKGDTVLQVLQDQPHLIPNIRAIQQFASLVQASQHRSLRVYVLYGPPGTGKTRWAYDTFPDLFSKPDGDWWDGYRGQKVVLLDDFYGGIPYHTMLKVADRYPLSLPVKGGFTPALYDTLVITSNKQPSEWYESGLRALQRRLTDIVHLTETGHVVFQTNAEYFAPL